jgi:hypothetical protein
MNMFKWMLTDYRLPKQMKEPGMLSLEIM